jgi:hypothetical protein
MRARIAARLYSPSTGKRPDVRDSDEIDAGDAPQLRSPSMVDGPRAGLAGLDAPAGDRRLAEHHRLAAVRAHLQEMVGDTQAALTGYEDAARRTTSIPEQRYLQAQAERLRGDVENPPTAPTIG